MSRAKKPAPRIPPKQWPIKLPKPGRYGYYDSDTYSGMSYSHAERMLLELGFENIWQVEGVKLSQVQYSRTEDRKSSLWQHPAGVFIRMSSYGCAQERHGKSLDPPEPGVSSIYVSTQFNTGIGYNPDSYGLSGSGMHHLQPDGTQVADRSYRCAGPGDKGLLQTLAGIQGCGRLLPFSQWVGERHLFLQVEDYFAPQNPERLFGMTIEQATQATQDDSDLAARRLIASAPEGLGHLLKLSIYHTPRKKPERTDGRKENLWQRTEQASDLFGSYMKACGKIEPDAQDTALFTTWIHAIDRVGEPFGLQDRALESGPGGASLLAGLIAVSGQPHMAQRLLELVAFLPSQALAAWCRDPDSRGHTAISDLLRVVCDPKNECAGSLLSTSGNPGTSIAAMEAICAKIGQEGLSITTPGKTIEEYLDPILDDGKPLNHAKAMLAHNTASVLLRAGELGILPKEACVFTDNHRVWDAFSSIEAVGLLKANMVAQAITCNPGLARSSIRARL